MTGRWVRGTVPGKRAAGHERGLGTSGGGPPHGAGAPPWQRDLPAASWAAALR